MRADRFEQQLRQYETALDLVILPGVWTVARLDGRNFTRLVRERHPFAAPFDRRFVDMMVHTTRHLMGTGFNVVFGITHSDEISLLIHPNETSFGRQQRKWLSLLAGEASAAFSVQLGDVASFDCRLALLPRAELVVDYFRWRAADSHRNALNAHCYWLLRGQGLDAQAADARLLRMSVAAKNELLFANGVNFNDIPAWQKRGIGLIWTTVEQPGVDPRSNTPTTATRRVLQEIEELPMGEAYDALVAAQMQATAG